MREAAHQLPLQKQVVRAKPSLWCFQNEVFRRQRGFHYLGTTYTELQDTEPLQHVTIKSTEQTENNNAVSVGCDKIGTVCNDCLRQYVNTSIKCYYRSRYSNHDRRRQMWWCLYVSALFCTSWEVTRVTCHCNTPDNLSQPTLHVSPAVGFTPVEEFNWDTQMWAMNFFNIHILWLVVKQLSE